MTTGTCFCSTTETVTASADLVARSFKSLINAFNKTIGQFITAYRQKQVQQLSNCTRESTSKEVTKSYTRLGVKGTCILYEVRLEMQPIYAVFFAISTYLSKKHLITSR